MLSNKGNSEIREIGKLYSYKFAKEGQVLEVAIIENIGGNVKVQCALCVPFITSKQDLISFKDAKQIALKTLRRNLSIPYVLNHTTKKIILEIGKAINELEKRTS